MRWSLRDRQAELKEDLPLVVLALAALGLALLGLLSGCAPPGNSKADRLLDEVNAFNNAVRWDRREEAMLRLPAGSRSAFLDRLEEIEKDIRIDDWELDRAQVDWKKGQARFRVHFMWHSERDALVRKTYVEQRWRRMGKKWLMTRTVTRVGEPVPSFEPPENPVDELDEKLDGEAAAAASTAASMQDL